MFFLTPTGQLGYGVVDLGDQISYLFEVYQNHKIPLINWTSEPSNKEREVQD